MKTEQISWSMSGHWNNGAPRLGASANLVLVFGSNAALAGDAVADVRRFYPSARIAGCSTAGEICGTRVQDDSLVATAIQLEQTELRCAQTRLTDATGSFDAGQRLTAELAGKDLTHVLVLSDGLEVNGTELVRGLLMKLPAGVAVTGGLSGDGARFQHTAVMLDDAPQKGRIVALGFYGNRLKAGYGSRGGWDPFGPERRVTRSHANVLKELDGQPALALYRKYLGEHASGLPATGLLFPLSVRTGSSDTGLVRTILSVDEKEGSLTFAGDVPQGAFARLMKANFERLIEGAAEAARVSQKDSGGIAPELAILISCVGRKLLLKGRIEEEVEMVHEVLGGQVAMTGFYSYGELCPFAADGSCELHNQTMTITTFSEN
jgi:hypothetical protein